MPRNLFLNELSLPIIEIDCIGFLAKNLLLALREQCGFSCLTDCLFYEGKITPRVSFVLQLVEPEAGLARLKAPLSFFCCVCLSFNSNFPVCHKLNL